MPTVSERIDPAAARRAVLERLARGDLLGGADQGARLLEDAPDAEVALAVIGALSTLGLGAPAREILAAHEGALRGAGADVAALGRGLAPVPTGRAAWEEHAARFEANLALLHADRPWLEHAEPRLRAAMGAHQIFRTAGGLLQLSRRTRSGARRWVPGLVDWAAAVPAGLRLDSSSPALALLGAGAHELLERLHQATRAAAGTRQPPLVLLEPEWSRLALWLHAADRTAILSDPRVLIFAGPDAVEDLARHLALHEDLEPPRILLRVAGEEPAWADLRRALAAVDAARSAAHESLCAILKDRAAARRPQEWAARLAPGATILGLVSRFTTVLKHSMRDIGQTLESLGYRFVQVSEDADHLCHTTLTTARAVAETDPALVIMINHLRGELPASLGAVPALTWIQDPVPALLNSAAGASIGPLDFVCGFYAGQCVEQHGYPPQRFHSIHFIPVSSRQFHDAPLPPEAASGFESDLVYVGNAQGTVQALLERTAAEQPRHLGPLLAAIADDVEERVAAGRHLDQAGAERLVRDLVRAQRVALEEPRQRHLASFFAHRLFDIRFRLETLRWAADWARRRGRRFRIFGRGWEAHPELSPFAAGPIEHGTESRLAYRGARLTLQTVPGGLAHQRTFEGLLCGSLVLGRYSPADFCGLTVAEFRARHGDGSPDNRALYEDGFRGLHRVVFATGAELDALAERHLADEPARRALVAELAHSVRARFTYDGVVPPLLERLRRSLGAA
jgi:hypothetical protein